MNIKTIKFTEEWDFHKRIYIILLDTDNNKIAGKGTVVECEDNVTLEGVYVQPEYRGQGIGHFLMEELEQVYLLYTQVFLKVKSDNMVAKSLYNTFNFGFYKVEDPGVYEWMIFENKSES